MLASGVPVESMRDQVSPSAVQTARSRPAPELCHDPTSAAASGASTPSIRSPAPQPPKVLNACGCSRTPVTDPLHTLQRTLPCAPPRSPPTARTRRPSETTEYQAAVRPYPVAGTAGTSVAIASGPSRSRRGSRSSTRDPDQHVLAGRGEHLGHRAGREVDRDEADGGGTGSTGGGRAAARAEQHQHERHDHRPSDSDEGQPAKPLRASRRCNATNGSATLTMMSTRPRR